MGAVVLKPTNKETWQFEKGGVSCLPSHRWWWWLCCWEWDYISTVNCSDRWLGRAEGSEQRWVLQRWKARVGGVSEDEALPGEEVGRRHPDLPQALLILRPEEKLIGATFFPPHSVCFHTHTHTQPKICSKKTNPQNTWFKRGGEGELKETSTLCRHSVID